MRVFSRSKGIRQSLMLLKAILLISTTVQTVDADLTIGSKAPAIEIEHWISDAGGKLKPVTDFQEGNVYVVEFWATWCGPCVASMPHLAELQKKYLDKNVQIISVSDEDLDTVEQFLKRNVPAGIVRSLQKPKEESDTDGSQAGSAEDLPDMTFGQLTSAWSLTTDPDQSVYQDYMEASGEGGIPTAFIVGKKGVIEWIGHPMEIDEPLAKIVADQWDREAYLKERLQQQELEQSIMEVYGMVQQGKVQPALQTLEELAEKHEGTSVYAGLQSLRVSLLLQLDPEKATAALKDAASKIEDPQSLNGLAWSIVEHEEEDGTEVPDDLLALAVEVAEKALKLAPEDASIVDTLAHLAYIKGDIDRAIDLQSKAVRLAPDVEELKQFLETLKNEKEGTSR